MVTVIARNGRQPLRLERYAGNPILQPRPDYPWESRNVFNAGIAQLDGLIFMVYRAQGAEAFLSPQGWSVSPSRLGLAYSRDGFSFSRFEEPVFEPFGELESYGVEDPRLTLLEGKIYMAYVAYSEAGTRVALASTSDFRRWERLGVVIREIENKNAALFPQRIGGRYAMLHRIPNAIWIAYSEDLIHWRDFDIVMLPRPGCWDSRRIGIGGPPIEVEEGWLLIYHGFNEARVYRMGLALLDRDDPRRVLARLEEPILEPEQAWELEGDVPNVVFSCGQAVLGDRLLVYYGAADRTLAVAMTTLEEALAAVRAASRDA